MAHNISKSKKAKLKKKRSQNKIKKMEKEDSLGISRKKLRGGMNEKVFIILKIISIVLIPLIYFIYSPLLIFAVIFAALMLLFATMAERKINHTFIKANHMKISKLDSIVAIVVILVTITGTIINSNTKKKMSDENILTEIKMSVKNFGSCLTGSRSVIKSVGMGMHFGTKDFDPGSMPSAPPHGGRPPEDFSIEDLPLDIVFSHMISSINTVLIFIIPITGTATLLYYIYKKKKFDLEMNTTIKDEYIEISNEEMEKIFTFGYLRDSLGNLIVDDVAEEEIILEITTPKVETVMVDDFESDDSEYGEIDNV